MWCTSVGLMKSNLRDTEVSRSSESKKGCVGVEDKRRGASRAPGSGPGVAPCSLLLLDLMGQAEPRAREKYGVCDRRLRPNDAQDLADV